MDDSSKINIRYQEETVEPVKLNEEDQTTLIKQNLRIVSEFKAQELDRHAKKYWDIFYKRNGDRFFKDRHWTTREFTDIARLNNDKKQILEIGCGVGNFIYPLLTDGLNADFYACDFSPRAIECLKSNPFYNPSIIKAFTCDIVNDKLQSVIPKNSLDIVTSIFVLSAINPDNHQKVVQNIHEVLKNGGRVLFRDYGLHDMTQLRFKPGHKISENFYMRQDGTRSYFFSIDYLHKLFTENGFKELSNKYVCKRTINIKEEIDVPRRFIQATFFKQS
ncbi:tRNA N(3)-methylcytidine methyltransferase METTL6 [Daktulosphaira vitifoliae]|uniref:tRNA N(3)-methylcytidine methyltransferase METTL6 n=1 Tax=Daktulosphaira vitifoliae TaxID=58002 RepID=UPI0021AA6D88|nr:tRNA N(3)-methylcytidine methyltransferase METTL6 [Daktulosphaira vitifoliae]